MGAWAAPVDCGAAAIGSGDRLKRQPRDAAAAKAAQTIANVANSLIREEFFQVPKMLSGTGNS
jgi:hypothetical protein